MPLFQGWYGSNQTCQMNFKPRNPIRKVSKKRTGQLAEYARLRKKFLEDHPYCQWWLKECGEGGHSLSEEYAIKNNGWFRIDSIPCLCPRSTQIHHTKGRTGEMLLRTEFWLAVSDEGHRAIHADPKKSYEMGYMIKRS